MRTQRRLYRETQDDYWEARSRRARRILGFRSAAKTAGSVLIVLAVLAVADTILNGKFGDVTNGVANLVRHATGPSTESAIQVADSINEVPGTMVTSDSPKTIVAMYQPGDGGSYMVACVNPQGTNGSLSGVLSYADIGGWDCILVNEMSAIIGSAFSGVTDWSSLSDLAPYLAPGSVIRGFAAAAGGTFVSA